MTRLRVLTYNIHKGFQGVRGELVLDQIRHSLRQSEADILFLQEVVGEHLEHAETYENWPLVPQFEFLADEVWDHYAYGKNAVTDLSDHGNAILSKFPIESCENIDISTNPHEQRGLLHAQIRIPETGQIVHLMNLHLNLLHRGRRIQINRVIERANSTVERAAPLIIGGDFNDWPNKLSEPLHRSLQTKEAFEWREGSCAKTFPSFLPLLKLDRIYFRNFKLIATQRYAGRPWSELSDHLAISADFEI